MRSVGIIANPASGKDIRRLIANGTVVTNQEKINTVIRMVKAMDSLGVEQVRIMPDPTHIAERVINEVADELKTTKVKSLELPYLSGTYKDTLRSVQRMKDENFACVIVMGGDGTSRVVSKVCGDMPMIPVSTGTNNVFPQMIEGTLAGLAAGAIATGVVRVEEGCHQVPILELRNDKNELIDSALVDLVVVDSRDIGSRAVWEPESIRELYLTMARPTQIGLSSIGSWLSPLPIRAGKGLRVILGEEGNTTVKAPIAPGLISEVKVVEHNEFEPNESVAIQYTPCVVALDGEREVLINRDELMFVQLNRQGPVVVDIDKTLELAAKNGLMVRDHSARAAA